MLIATATALGLTGIGQARAFANQDKVEVCHHDAETSSWRRISVAKGAEAAHQAHGDYAPGPGKCCGDMECAAQAPTNGSAACAAPGSNCEAVYLPDGG